MVKEACGASKATEETGRRKTTLNRKKFNRRRETLLKQGNALRILCGCQVAMFCVQPDGGQMEVWESGEGVLHNTLKAYLQDQQTDPNKKSRRKLTVENYKEQQQQQQQQEEEEEEEEDEEEDEDEDEEPVESGSRCSTEGRMGLRLGLGSAEDSWETSNCCDDDNMETGDSTKLPLISDDEINCEDNGNQIDLELRLGFNSTSTN